VTSCGWDTYLCCDSAETLITLLGVACASDKLRRRRLRQAQATGDGQRGNGKLDLQRKMHGCIAFGLYVYLL
jgi:chloramphenicol 3-O-phosphotransferase